MTSFSIGQIGSGLLAQVERGDTGAKNYESSPGFCSGNRFPRHFRGISSVELEARKARMGVEGGYFTSWHALECR